jgi:hypothetical protein
MNCPSQKQIADYLNGTPSEEVELHLIQCRDCRTVLRRMHADRTESFSISKDLTEKTLQKIRATNTPAQESSATPLRIRQFPKRYLFAMAASLLIAITGLAYFAKTVRKPHVSTVLPIAVPSSELSTQKSVDSGSISQTMTVWLDTIKVKDIKDVPKNIAIKKDKGTVIRLSKKTGILTDPLTVLNILSRTDTTVVIELIRGNALFTVEKKWYRQFCVVTPHVRIFVTGTIFSVFVDSIRTKVNVLEGRVQLVPIVKSDVGQTIEQGDEAIANGDSIAATEIMNRLTAKKRGSMLLDYLQSTVMGRDIRNENDSLALPKVDK